MTTYEKIRQEARYNERISVLDREQSRIERQMADLEKKREGVVKKINYELLQLRNLQRLH